MNFNLHSRVLIHSLNKEAFVVCCEQTHVVSNAPPNEECMVLYSYQIIFKDLYLTFGNWLLAQTSGLLLEMVVSRFL